MVKKELKLKEKNMVLLEISITKRKECTLMNCIRNLPKVLKAVHKCLMKFIEVARYNIRAMYPCRRVLRKSVSKFVESCRILLN